MKTHGRKQSERPLRIMMRAEAPDAVTVLLGFVLSRWTKVVIFCLFFHLFFFFLEREVGMVDGLITDFSCVNIPTCCYFSMKT